VIAARNTALLEWFEINGRSLPWRTTTDPYPVLVSEVMLQQTQVARVIPKFISFMETWPDVVSLASADTDDLLRSWSGLGYNNRALRLRATARIVAEEGWPDSISGLREFPGIGPYTAAALGSISFGFDVPSVDTNLRRVLSRWAGEPLPPSGLTSYAEAVLGTPAGDWNQALMDLGAAVCSATEPSCGLCPVQEWCLDPSVYATPRPQTRFNGSRRQLRGALLRAHLAGADLHEAGQDLNRSATEIASAIEMLLSEGLLTPTHPAESTVQ
jgi:A/G-specific adenine glycosylase